MTSLSTWLRGRSELGMALMLGAAGALVLWDATQLHAPYSQSDPVGPKTVPYLVAALLFFCAAWLVLDVLRGGHGEAEGGEDVDLNQPSEWRVVVPLVAAFVANILLIDRLGWVLSGTILFWGSVWALGSRHYVRDFLISLALSLITFYGFYAGLGIFLPAGLLEGVL
ncbi:MAG TPA: tripartite tricarboxylate transporter TctB family protein [Nocardioidaceae bacterium]|nr:tripartite tricarboxylate transporter TctB family protein [Nocardioidaceae bacterium]